MKRILLTIVLLLCAVGGVNGELINIATVGQAISSGDLAALGTKGGAFDGTIIGTANNSTQWFSGTPIVTSLWIGQDFGTTKVVIEYALYFNINNALGFTASRVPYMWDFEGANISDFSDAVLLDAHTGSIPTYETWNVYAFVNTTAYRYYRLKITAVGDGTLSDYAFSTEMQMFEAVKKSAIQNTGISSAFKNNAYKNNAYKGGAFRNQSFR